jgi:hypothetical protein
MVRDLYTRVDSTRRGFEPAGGPNPREILVMRGTSPASSFAAPSLRSGGGNMRIDIREGARRISVIGNWMIAAGGCLLLLLVIFSFWYRTSVGLMDGVASVLPGIGVRLFAWVLDGFAGSSKPDHIESEPGEAWK